MLEGALRLMCNNDVEDVLQPWCGCNGSRQSPVACLLGEGGGGEGPLPTRHREDLLDGVLYHGPPWG
jgi:hypothetical protein